MGEQTPIVTSPERGGRYAALEPAFEDTTASAAGGRGGYKRVLYVLDPNEATRAARGQRVGIEEQEDGSLSFWHGEPTLLATAFPKEHGVQQGEVVENKRLSATRA